MMYLPASTADESNPTHDEEGLNWHDTHGERAEGEIQKVRRTSLTCFVIAPFTWDGKMHNGADLLSGS